MNLGDVKDEYNPGEVITCAAEGNPSPDIYWVDDTNATVTEEATLIIDPSMEGTQTYSCVATNEFRGTTFSERRTITFNVTSKFVFFSYLEFFLSGQFFNFDPSQLSAIGT